MRFVSLTALVLLVGCGSNPPPASPNDPANAAAPTAKPAASASASATPSAAGLKAPGEAKVGDKTKCPISGEDFTVSENSPKAEHNGKTYYFCCPGCEKKFKENPQKYTGT